MCNVTLIILGVFGLALSTVTKRPLHFKIKLITVFFIMLATGLLESFTRHYEYTVYTNSILFLLVIILYWNELKHSISISGYNRSLFITSLDFLPDFIWIKDKNGKITYVNKKAREFFHNLDDKIILGKTFEELVDYLSKIGIYYNFTNCDYKDNQTYSEKIQYGHINNEYLVLRIHKINIYSNSNEVIASIHRAIDLTKQCVEHQKLLTYINANRIEDLKHCLHEHVKSIEY